jgi:hypothetical protein
MKDSIEMLEDLFKLDSSSQGTRIDIRSIRCGMEVRLTVGNCHSHFEVYFTDPEYRAEFTFKYQLALRDLKFLLTNN